MPLKTCSLFFASLFILALPACTTLKKDAGYYKFKTMVSADSAAKIKAAILSVDNGLFRPFGYTDKNGIAIRYRMLSPAAESPAEKYPLVLVLHGSGAIGTDNISQLGILAKLWAQPGMLKKYPAYVIAPQFSQRSSNYSTDRQKNVLVSVPDPCLLAALALIDSLQKTLRVDKRRIYVIGFSMGASGVINSIGLRPHLFAAGISVSGIPDFDHVDALAQVPLWIVHGNADNENPFQSDSLLYKQLQSRHALRLKFWEIDGLEHVPYPGLYTGDIIPRWLFGQSKPATKD